MKLSQWFQNRGAPLYKINSSYMWILLGGFYVIWKTEGLYMYMYVEFRMKQDSVRALRSSKSLRN